MNSHLSCNIHENISSRSTWADSILTGYVELIASCGREKLIILSTPRLSFKFLFINSGRLIQDCIIMIMLDVPECMNYIGNVHKLRIISIKLIVDMIIIINLTSFLTKMIFFLLFLLNIHWFKISLFNCWFW